MLISISSSTCSKEKSYHQTSHRHRTQFIVIDLDSSLGKKSHHDTTPFITSKKIASLPTETCSKEKICSSANQDKSLISIIIFSLACLPHTGTNVKD
jgi:hypothetical protein